MTKSDLAVQFKHSGYNCAQAVVAAFAEDLGINLETARALGAGFGAGMGTMGATCGALCGAQIVLGDGLHGLEGRCHRQGHLLLRRLRCQRGADFGGAAVSRAFARTELLLGEEAMQRLQNARVAVFGVGGVGGYVVEALARSGVGALDLIDNDTVAESNLNRQIIALRSTIGQYKTDAAKARIMDINPDCRVTVYHTFYLPENAHTFDFSQYDYIVDAIDTVKGKLALVEQAQAAGTPVICSMGAGNKLDPTRFEVADIYKTSVCPLARVMRYECKKRGVKRLKVVYSKEPPVRPVKKSDEQTVRRDIPGSTAFVPSVAGLIIAGEVIKDMIG